MLDKLEKRNDEIVEAADCSWAFALAAQGSAEVFVGFVLGLLLGPVFTT